MATRMGVRELRDNLTSVIRRVRQGETIEITNRHERVALLTPVQKDKIARLAQAGDITRGTPLSRPLRRHPVTTGTTASQALEEDRAER